MPAPDDIEKPVVEHDRAQRIFVTSFRPLLRYNLLVDVAVTCFFTRKPALGEWSRAIKLP